MLFALFAFYFMLIREKPYIHYTKLDFLAVFISNQASGLYVRVSFNWIL